MLTRYYKYELFQQELDRIVRKESSPFSLKTIGYSVLKKPIYLLQAGSGSIKVFMWSQMHGNESTTTRALLDLIDQDDFKPLLDKIELYIIPILNPDGAENWTRENANKVDLNRNAVLKDQPETMVFFEQLELIKPDMAFNLHGQRTIFGTEDGSKPCQLSFLAPASNHEKSFNPARLKAVKVINSIYSQLQPDLNTAICRYSDDFNENCFGDYLTSRNIPTVLFEAGHAGLDYHRDEITSIIKKAILTALQSLYEKENKSDNQLVESYLSIPQISKTFCDIVLRYEQDDKTVFTSLMYKEVLEEGRLILLPRVNDINPETVRNAHRIMDVDGQLPEDLKIDENNIVKSEVLGIKNLIII
ncbi:M14 family zinc carboxypeptidase [Nonlabens tegetincola]|uniref:M14 family zinc carboxypeptidase n=1 Tax=Nonlabens tegetincola TaxID=323273 RepID=UPI0030C829E4